MLLTFNKNQAIHNIFDMITEAYVKIGEQMANLDKLKGMKTAHPNKACFSLCILHYSNEMGYISDLATIPLRQKISSKYANK